MLEKKFCPHVLKLFLSINQEKSGQMLSLTRSTLESWKFESRLTAEFPAQVIWLFHLMNKTF